LTPVYFSHTKSL